MFWLGNDFFVGGLESLGSLYSDWRKGRRIGEVAASAYYTLKKQGVTYSIKKPIKVFYNASEEFKKDKILFLIGVLKNSLKNWNGSTHIFKGVNVLYSNGIEFINGFTDIKVTAKNEKEAIEKAANEYLAKFGVLGLLSYFEVEPSKIVNTYKEIEDYKKIKTATVAPTKGVTASGNREIVFSEKFKGVTYQIWKINGGKSYPYSASYPYYLLKINDKYLSDFGASGRSLVSINGANKFNDLYYLKLTATLTFSEWNRLNELPDYLLDKKWISEHVTKTATVAPSASEIPTPLDVTNELNEVTTTNEKSTKGTYIQTTYKTNKGKVLQVYEIIANLSKEEFKELVERGSGFWYDRRSKLIYTRIDNANWEVAKAKYNFKNVGTVPAEYKTATAKEPQTTPFKGESLTVAPSENREDDREAKAKKNIVLLKSLINKKGLNLSVKQSFEPSNFKYNINLGTNKDDLESLFDLIVTYLKSCESTFENCGNGNGCSFRKSKFLDSYKYNFSFDYRYTDKVLKCLRNFEKQQTTPFKKELREIGTFQGIRFYETANTIYANGYEEKASIQNWRNNTKRVNYQNFDGKFSNEIFDTETEAINYLASVLKNKNSDMTAKFKKGDVLYVVKKWDSASPIGTKGIVKKVVLNQRPLEYYYSLEVGKNAGGQAIVQTLPESVLDNKNSDMSTTKAAIKPQSKIPPFEILQKGEPGTVYLVPVKMVKTRTDLFQNRKSEYASRSVDNILNAIASGRFSWALFDSILIFWDIYGLIGTKDEFYVISGHSRLEAFKKLGGKTVEGRNTAKIPAKIVTSKDLTAIREIALNSNTLGTKESYTERAEYFRTLRELGKTATEIREKAKETEGSNASRIVAYSFLSRNGKAIDTIARLEPAIDSSTRNAGAWLGRARNKFDVLSDFHENEIWDWLIANIGKKVSKYADFIEFMEKVIGNKTIQPDKPLNIASKKVETNYDKEFQKLVNAQLGEVKKIYTLIENNTKRYVQAGLDFKEIQEKLGNLYNSLTVQQIKLFKLLATKVGVKEANKQLNELFGIDGVKDCRYKITGLANYSQSVFGNEKVLF